MPLRIIHAVRNPFDIISTITLTQKTHFKVFSNSVNTTSAADQWSSHTNGKYHLEVEELKNQIERMFAKFEAVAEMIAEVFGRENIPEGQKNDWSQFGTPKVSLSV